MSVEYIFNKKISFDDINEKTSLKVVENNGSRWILDPLNNQMLIKEKNYVNVKGESVDGPTLELIVYGINNSNMIRDELVKHFNVKFITDNELEMFFHDHKLLEKIDEIYDSVMVEYGYIINGDNIIIPNRNSDDYERHSLYIPPTNIKTNNLINDGESDLPF
jgi:hypothetical protein